MRFFMIIPQCLAALIFLLLTTPVSAFVGPGAQQPGVGGGLFYTDTNRNIGFGSNNGTPLNIPPDGNYGKVFMIASTSLPSLGLKNLTSNPVARTFLLASRADGAFVIYDDKVNAIRLLLDKDGNIGLPTIEDGARLSVSGSGYYSSRLAVATSVPPVGVALAVGDDVNVDGAVNALVLSGAYNGLVSAGNVTAGVFGSAGGGGNFSVPSRFGVATTTNIGLPQELSVYGDGYFKDKVGIGTTTPGQVLSVVGSAYITNQYLGKASDSPSAPAYSWDGYTNSGLFRATGNNSVGIAVEGVEVVRASSSGRIGVGGVTQPDAPVHVLSSLDYRGITLQVSTNTLSTGLAFRNSGTSYSWYFGRVDALNNDADLVFSHGPGADPRTFTPELVLTKNDRVGVGTAVPSHKLDVQGGQVNASGGYCINGTCIASWNDVANSSGWLHSTGTVRLITDTDNVGIGTASPAYKLDVSGSFRVTDRVIIGDVLTVSGTGTSSILGNLDIDGVLTAGAVNGSLTGLLSAGNVSAGQFGQLAGGGFFSFGSKLSVGTTTTNASQLNVTGNNNDVVRISGSGPNSALLSVFYGGARRGYFLADDGVNGNNEFYVSQDSANANMLRLGSNSSDLVILNNGNIGLGVIQPDLSLVVNGDTRFRGGADAIRLNTGVTEWGSISIADGNGRVNIYENASSSGTYYTATEGANRMSMGTNGIDFYSAPSGSAGTLINWTQTARLASTGMWLSARGVSSDFTVSSNGRVGVGTSSPGQTLSVQGTLGVTGDVSLSNSNLSGVNKLTVGTIDPLYEIAGERYATYAASVVGGVYEEYLGKGKLVMNDLQQMTYEYVIDFTDMEKGSDLWVWRKVIDFSKDSVVVTATPYGVPANIYYEISENGIVFKADQEVEFSYRLSGKRFDWRDWPTVQETDASKDKPSFVLP